MSEREIKQCRHDRLIAVDILKCVSVLMIIFVHSGQLFKHGNLLYECSRFGQMGVQIFFVLSGFTLSASWDRRKQSINEFYIRRLTTIAPGYYFDLLFFLALTLGLRCAGIYRYWEQNHTIGALLSNVLFIHGFFPAYQNTVVPGGWYIGTTMVLYAFFPLIMRSMDYLAQYNRKVLLCVPLAFTSISLLVWGGVNHLTGVELLGNNSFMYFSAITQLPCFLIGIVTYKLYRNVILDKINILCFCCAMIGVFSLAITIWLFYRNVLYGFAVIPFFMGLCAASVLTMLLFVTESFCPKGLTRLCRAISTVSYEMYLLHTLYAYFLMWAVKKVMFRIGINSDTTVFFLAAYIVVVLATYFNAKVLHSCLKKCPEFFKRKRGGGND